MLKRQETIIADGVTHTDEDLLQLMQAGAGDYAFSLLVKRHGQRFYGLAYRIVGRPDEAEDIVQNAFIRLWLDPFKFSLGHGTKFTTWFYRLVTNMAIDAHRRRRPGMQPLDNGLADTIADGSILPDQGRQQEDVSRDLLAAMKILPLRQQVAIELHYFDGLPQKDAAFVMQLTEKAYQSLLHRGRQQLRKILPPDMLVGTSL